MVYFVFLLLFLFGVSFGSFLNVLICRFREGEPFLSPAHFRGRSRCPDCKKTLSWKELIPLFSFLIQRGRCLHCGRPISFQYPLVEFLSGLIFVGLPLYFFNFYNIGGLALAGADITWYYFEIFVWILTFLVFLLIAMIDFRLKLIPDGLNLTLAFLGLALVSAVSYFDQPDFFSRSFLGPYSLLFGALANVWFNHFLAGVFGAIFFGAVYFFSRGRGIGFGDVKLAAAGGWLLGWPDIILAVFLAFIIGGAWGAAAMALKRKKLKDTLPFAPFLIVGFVLTIFFGFFLIDFYFKILGI